MCSLRLNSMTTVIVLFASAFAIVSGISNEGSDDYLKGITKNTLNDTKHLIRDIEITLADIKKVNASVLELLEKIPSIVSKNEAVLDIQKTLNDAVVHNTKTGKCQKIFEKKVKELTFDVQNRISIVFKKQFDDAEEKLSYLKEDLINIENALKNDLEKEIRGCQEYGYQCMITETDIPDKEKYIDFVFGVKTVVNILIEYVTQQLDSIIVPARSEEVVLKPVTKCLKNNFRKYFFNSF